MSYSQELRLGKASFWVQQRTKNELPVHVIKEVTAWKVWVSSSVFNSKCNKHSISYIPIEIPKPTDSSLCFKHLCLKLKSVCLPLQRWMIPAYLSHTFLEESGLISGVHNMLHVFRSELLQTLNYIMMSLRLYGVIAFRVPKINKSS